MESLSLYSSSLAQFLLTLLNYIREKARLRKEATIPEKEQKIFKPMIVSNDSNTETHKVSEIFAKKARTYTNFRACQNYKKVRNGRTK